MTSPIRADLHVNGSSRKLYLPPSETEKAEHLSLKLAAYILFWEDRLTVDASVKHPALAGQDYRPDLLGTDVSGSVALWVECGNTTMNKIGKVLRRWSSARVLVLKEGPQEARRLRAELEKEEAHARRVEILHWPAGGFAEWHARVGAKTEVFGETTPTAMNLVVNEQTYVADLERA